jgi:hypothetical protein
VKRARTVLLVPAALAAASFLAVGDARSAGGDDVGGRDLAGLQWSRRGEWLLVADRWLLDTVSGSVHVLPRIATDQHASFSPDGRRLLLAGERELRWGVSGGSLAERVGIPLWVREDDSGSEYAAGATRSFAFWLSERAILVHQANPFAGDACRRFDVVERAWVQPSGPCPAAPGRIETILAGADGWLLIFFALEGWSAAQLTRYDPEQGQEQFTVRELAPPLPLHLSEFQLGEEPGLIFVSSGCDLPCRPFPGPCDCPPERSWTVYRGRPPAQHLVRWLSDLPPRAVPSPDGRRLAWIEGRSVCVGPIGSSTPSRCMRLPQ